MQLGLVDWFPANILYIHLKTASRMHPIRTSPPSCLVCAPRTSWGGARGWGLGLFG